jgi:hypothetical protein
MQTIKLSNGDIIHYDVIEKTNPDGSPFINLQVREPLTPEQATLLVTAFEAAAVILGRKTSRGQSPEDDGIVSITIEPITP